MQEKPVFRRHRAYRLFIFCLAVGWLALFVPPARAQSAEETATGEAETLNQRLPRFASLRSDEVNVRAGPGTRYSINWIYRRRGLPLEVTQEFDQWREVRDSEGSIGWVHKNMLDGQRSAVITGAIRTLRRTPEDGGVPLLRAEPGVLARIVECDKEWCRLQIDSRKGWLPKQEFWGVYPDEIF